MEPQSSISRYIQMVRSIPKLSREEELSISRAWVATHQKCYSDRLVKANLRYVVDAAVKYRNYGVSMEDLIAEGNCGLYRALEKYDPETGNRFVTYAIFWVRNTMLYHVLRSWTMASVNGPIRSGVFFRLRKERAILGMLVGEDTQKVNQLLATKLGLSVGKIEEYLKRIDAHGDLSLDEPILGIERQDLTYMDVIVTTDPDQEEVLENKKRSVGRSELVSSALGRLSDRERYIATHRLMVDPEDELTLEHIGKQWGVSRERVRQIEVRTRKKLKNYLLQLQPVSP